MFVGRLKSDSDSRSATTQQFAWTDWLLNQNLIYLDFKKGIYWLETVSKGKKMHSSQHCHSVLSTILLELHFLLHGHHSMAYKLNLMVSNYMIKLATCRLRPCGIFLFHLLNALIHPPVKIIDKFYSRSLRYSLLSERLSVSPLYWKQSVTSISYLTVSLPVCAFFVLLLHPPVWKDSCPPSLNQDKCSQRLGPSVILWSKLNCAEAFL